MVSSASGESRERPNFSAPQDIVGEYRVAAIDGEGLDQPYGNALSITASEISFEPKCAGSV